MLLDLIPAGRVVTEPESFWIAAGKKPIYQLLERRQADVEPSLPQVVLAGIPGRLPEHVRGYKPLEVHGLFLTFAATPPTPEGILEFANHYGVLGDVAEIWVVPQDASDYKAFIYHFGQNAESVLDDLEYRGEVPMEAIAAWKNEMIWMRHLTQLWQAEQAKDWKALRRNICWEGGTIIHRWQPTEKRYERRNDPRDKGEAIWGDDVLRNQDGSMLFRRGDLAGPAMYFIMRAVNDEIAHRVRPKLTWSLDRHRPELTYRVTGLLGPMYWQFAQAIDKGWKYRQCPVCRKTFQLAPGENRTDRLTCSSTCRTYLYRQRMDKARQLHQQGQSPAAIAKKLKATLATVKKWIAKEQ